MRQDGLCSGDVVGLRLIQYVTVLGTDSDNVFDSCDVMSLSVLTYKILGKASTSD